MFTESAANSSSAGRRSFFDSPRFLAQRAETNFWRAAESCRFTNCEKTGAPFTSKLSVPVPPRPLRENLKLSFVSDFIGSSLQTASADSQAAKWGVLDGLDDVLVRCTLLLPLPSIFDSARRDD